MRTDNEHLVDSDWFAPPAASELSDVEVILHDVALSIACQITPRNPQYVIKRLLPDNCYKIITGMPPFSERHGIGEVGHLHTPVPKKALLNAIQGNEIVTIDDALHDETVGCYMAGHIKSKNIQSIAIVPIGRDRVRWLIVLDKVPPCEKGFSGLERAHLETCKITTERSLLHLSEEIVEANHSTLQNALKEYAHLFRNPLTAIGGFAKKLKETHDPERVQTYTDIIYTQARRLEEDFCSFMALVGYLFPNGQQKVGDRLEKYLLTFLSDPQYQLLGDPRLLECAVMVAPDVVHTFFGELKKYLRCSSGTGEKILVELVKEPPYAALFFYTSAFQEYKEDTDVRLPIFRQVAYQLNGDCRMGKGWCKVSLPLAETSLPTGVKR